MLIFMHYLSVLLSKNQVEMFDYLILQAPMTEIVSWWPVRSCKIQAIILTKEMLLFTRIFKIVQYKQCEKDLRALEYTLFFHDPPHF